MARVGTAGGGGGGAARLSCWREPMGCSCGGCVGSSAAWGAASRAARPRGVSGARPLPAARRGLRLWRSLARCLPRPPLAFADAACPGAAQPRHRRSPEPCHSAGCAPGLAGDSVLRVTARARCSLWSAGSWVRGLCRPRPQPLPPRWTCDAPFLGSEGGHGRGLLCHPSHSPARSTGGAFYSTFRG